MSETPEKIEISRETFNQFKEMGQTVMDLKKQLKDKDLIIAAYKASFELIVWCVMRFTATFGLNNPAGTMIRQTILNGEENPTRSIIKGVTSLMTDAALAETNKAKKDALEAKFSFFAYLPEVAKFHEEQKKLKVFIDPEMIKNLPPAVKNELLA